MPEVTGIGHTVAVTPFEKTRQVIWGLEDPEHDYIWYELTAKLGPGEDPFEVAYNLLIENGFFADSLRVVEEYVLVAYQAAEEAPGTLTKKTRVIAAAYSHHDTDGVVEMGDRILRARSLAEYIKHYGEQDRIVAAVQEYLQ